MPEGRSIYDKMYRLISHCDSQHRCYNGDSEPGKSGLPTRVLDISQGTSNIYLREAAGLHGRYICLSHCWGSKLPLRTTLDNLDKHQQNIPWDTFPVVYKETILISRRLGVHYVWIDSLCIVQDSKSDWAHESRSMCGVYANAYLTIAATASANCSVSMNQPLGISPDSQSETVLHQVGGCGSVEQHSLMSIETPIPGNCMRSSISRHGHTRTLPLQDRAWAFQEQMLSSRVIHLTGPELVWQCKREFLCDCPRQRDMTHYMDQKSGLFHQQLEAQTKLGYSQGNNSRSIAELWRTVVMGYTKRSLTYDADKLPALSGMAHMFARMRPWTTYIAGAWADTTESSTLLTDLMWYVDSHSYYNGWTTRRPPQWVAPTFSWASVRDQVNFATSPKFSLYPMDETFESGVAETHVEILEVNCQPSTEDPMGQINSGVLKVKGQAMLGTVKARKPGGVGGYTLTVGGVVFSPDSHFTQEKSFYPDVPKDAIWRQDSKGQGRGKKVDVVCVPWATIWTKRAHGHITEYRNHELVMVLHSSARNGEFNRVGLLNRRRAKGFFISQGEFDAVVAKSPSRFGDGGEVQTFTIV